MKYYNKILMVIAACTLLVSCADNFEYDFAADKPENITRYEYLDAYDALKTYIDRSANPDFKLGSGVSASDFLKKELVYSMTVANFDDVTAGNAMKYGSCVGDNGSMDFSQISKFVDAARSAGLSIYGHTLAWHSQQNNKYLNKLIADKELEVDPNETQDIEDAYVDYSTYTKFPFYVMEFEPQMIDGQMVSSNPDGAWIQYFVADGVPTKKDGNYKVTALIQGSSEGQLDVQMGNWTSNIKTPLKFTTEWKEVTVELLGVPAESSFVIFQPGTFKGDIRIKWLKVTHSEAPSISIPVPVAEYDFEDGKPLDGWGDDLSRTVEDGVFVVTNTVATDDWRKQLCHETTTPFEIGTTYFLKLKIKGSVAGSIPAAFQNPDGYKGCGNFSPIKVTTNWEEVTVHATCNGDNALRLLMNVGHYQGTLYMDDICVYWEKSANSIPLTPEEKKDTLTWAMNNWIAGMMEACEGYVTAWDVVNEAISGTDLDGDGIYDLQSATRGTVSAEDARNNFYWQDYLGDEDYVRTAVRLARQYGPQNMKLFINDFNLESWWDNNKKAESLIKWIEKWEADGVTKIDGIGTQMHVSYILNETDQQAQENAIVRMFELLAASGKLIKITELDMGIVDKAFGTGIKTENVTFEQQLKMSEFYTFIIKKYFEIIPAAQQYGITQWAATDSPAGSGWRGGEPIGLWDLNYNRKPTYAGFTDGLAVK